MSITVETSVILKNLIDASNQGDPKLKESFISKFKAFLKEKKKDPLLVAVLFENVITFTSTCIPMIATCKERN